MEKVKLKPVALKEKRALPMNLYDIRDGLVLDFDFAQIASNTVIDVSGKNNNGTIVGATAVNGYGSLLALDFDGMDDAVNFERIGIFDGNSSFTLLALFNTDGPFDHFQRIFCFQGESQLIMTFGDVVQNNQYTIRLSQGVGWNNVVTGPEVTAGEWVFAAVTYDPIMGWKLFHWGDLFDENPQTGNITPDGHPYNVMGNDAGGFSGRISVARIYDRALTMREVKNLSYIFYRKAGLL